MTISAGGRDLSRMFGLAVLPVRRYCSELAHALPSAVRQHTIFLVLVLAYWAFGLIVCALTGTPWTKTVTTYLATFQVVVPLMGACLIAWRALVIMIAERPALPLTQFRRELTTSLLAPRRIANAIPVLIGMLLFGGTFTVIKKSIPFFAPFSWDARFEEWDRWLHGGFAPWELLYPIFGNPPTTQVLNWTYNVWMIVLNLVWVWQAFSLRDPRLRTQFFVTFVLGWSLLGGAAAMLFSSAGPCYFGRVTGLPDPYAPLMMHLQAINETHTLWALHAQEMLWNLYVANDLGLGAGISAMPSLHVGIATLFALLGWRTHRRLGIALTIYAVLIMIGSVHLGWHYAIDGYAGALGMAAIWWIVGRLLARRERREWTGLAPGAAVADDPSPR